MRPLHVVLALVLFALSIGCSHELKVVGHGPSIHDQLTSRGYIAPPVDSITPTDSLHLLKDTVH